MKETVKQKAAPVLWLMLVCGITAGVILTLGAEPQELISLCGAEKKLLMCENGQWLMAAIKSFAGAGLIMAAGYLCGFCALGQPAELLISGLRGMGLGAAVRGVYLSGSVFKCMAAFLPYAVLSTMLILSALNDSLSLSMRYFGLSTTAENRLGLKNEVGSYSARYLLRFLILAALAVSDALAAAYILKL